MNTSRNMSSSWAFGCLDEDARKACFDHARSFVTSRNVKMEPLPLESQGGCSYTFKLTVSGLLHSQLLQVRPAAYALDMGVMSAAISTYGEFAPAARFLGSFVLETVGRVKVYLLGVVHGISYNKVRIEAKCLDWSTFNKQKRYITDLADFLARGWHDDMRRGGLGICTGKVGLELVDKIGRLTNELYSPALRDAASWTYGRLDLLAYLPVTLCHGDLIPSNLLIDEATTSIQGFIDWAEAEYLPFGIPLYGLEHLLGYRSISHPTSTFTYYSCAPDLRRHFWKELRERIPDLSEDPLLEKAVLLARDVGIFLWYGYAWE